MKKEQLLIKIEQPWSAFRGSYRRLTEAQMTQPGVTGDWSATDIIGHVTVWEEEALKVSGGSQSSWCDHDRPD